MLFSLNTLIVHNTNHIVLKIYFDEKKMSSVFFYKPLFLSVEILIMPSSQMMNPVQIVFIVKLILLKQ